MYILLFYSEYEGDFDDLVIGDEVEFSITSKGGKVAAEKLVKLPPGSIPQEVIQNFLQYVFLIDKYLVNSQPKGSQNTKMELILCE